MSSARRSRTRATRRRSSTSGCGAIGGRAARRSRSRTARSPAASSRSIAARYIAAASSSGACDQRARAMSSFSGAFGYTSSRYSDRCSGAERDGRIDRLEPLGRPAAPGSHIIRSRLTLSKPARARLAERGARASAPCSRDSRRSSSSRNDWTPKLSRLTPAARNAASRASVTVSGLASSVTSRPAATSNAVAARVDDAARSRRARAATACRRRNRSCRPLPAVLPAACPPARSNLRERAPRRSAPSARRRTDRD